jgi:hypothetical protein
LEDAIQIDCWQHLEQFGIRYLTGEACAYSMRGLCDLTEKGRDLMTDYLGLPPDVTFLPSWNPRIGDELTVASIMLHPSQLLSIGEFAMRRNGALAIMMRNKRTLVGLFTEAKVATYEEFIKENPEMAKIWQLWRCRSVGPSVGSRNVHQFSGRVA